MKKYVAAISYDHANCDILEKDVLAWADKDFDGKGPVVDDDDEGVINLFFFDLPDDTTDKVALMYGRGMFFSEEWLATDTVSVVISLGD